MTLTKTKGADLFTIQTLVEMHEEDGIPMLMTRLAVAVRKKLFIFVWKDTEFLETKELNIPDRIKAMAWVGPTKICLGFSGEYVLMDVETKVLTELFAPSGPPDGSGPMSALNNLYNMSIGSRGGKPLVTKIPNNEMLLAKDHISIFLGLDGTPTRKVGIEWTGIPEEMGYSYPYVVAILAKTVEVRNIQTQALVQQIELANAKILNQGKLLYIASGSQIWRLTPYSLAAQVDQLVEMFEYKEAVSLLDQMEPILLENKADKVKKIKMMYANDLFKRGQYDTAVTMFQELEADPETVISLYPEDIAGDMHSEETIQADEVELADERVPKPDTAQPAVVTSAAASIKSSTESARPSEYVPLTGQQLTEAVSYLIRFLTDRRQKLTKALNKEQDRSTLLHMATQVDTALLKAYMMNNDALVGPLVRVPNHCDVQECEKLLRDKKVTLEVLRDLGKNDTGPLHGVSQTVLYLQQLDIDHFDLVLKYSAWVFEKDPEQGMRIFIDDMVEDNIYPRDKVLDHLEKISSDLAIEYLEYIIHELGDTTPEFHNKLILAYLQKLKAMPRNTTVFMTTSTTYKAEKILSRLPYDDLYEEKAILLSRIGQHDQALNIYVYKLKNYRMAEDYCSKIYYEDPEQGHRMFLALLRVYLQPSSGGSPLIEPALELLARHGSQINVSEVLSTLPSDTHLKGLYPFFEKSIRESNRAHYENMIVKNLLKAEQLQVQEKMTFYRSRSIRISEDRMCPQCNKRIGNSVFAVFPNGAVVHYFCKEKMEQQRWKLGHQ
ncbi:vacuolar sorting protein 39 domain 2-domain-containing protein [Umbelopsis sp. AD052]|nr:vacuolar sorting protein 39 domain 2-domain-containing protein [Umbelopsis sp. AD052]